MKPALFLLIVLFAFTPSAPAQTSPPPQCPPPTRTSDAVDTYGKTSLPDPYRWLEDHDSPETRAWITAEQSCTSAALSKLPGRDALSARLSELLHTDDIYLPREKNGRYFFAKRLASEDLAKIYMRRSKDAPDELLVDPLPWSADHTASVVLKNVSEDGKLLYYGRREGGRDEVTIHALDVDAHRDLPDVLPLADYFDILPAPDGRSLYYTKATDDGPRAYVHLLGSDPKSDQLIFGQSLSKDKFLEIALSDDGAYMTYDIAYGWERDDIYLQDLRHHGPVVPVITGVKARFNVVFGAPDTLYLNTNWNAPHWHLFATKLSAPAREHWREIIPERQSNLQNVLPAGGKLVLQYLQDVTSHLEVADPEGKNPASIALPGLGTALLSGRWGSPQLLYSFQSFDLPETVFVRNLDNAQSSVWFRPHVPFDPADYQTEQVWYTSKDKTRIPMFLFHKKGLHLDAANPVLLTGYGGFDSTEAPYFVPTFAVFAEHGGIVASPNLRGGGEFGEDWHRAGMFEKKQNVFDDFIAAAEFLIAGKYTTPAKLSIVGGSNGGLLVGAALTQRPDLFQAVVCLYPLLDMLRYQKFLEGPYWIAEYGSADNPEQFPYLFDYSPYHHVEKGQKYPAVLFITGDGDTRVAPLHARKMAALLQASTASDRPILLLYDTKSGHSGGRPISKQIEERTDELSFLAWQLHIPLQ